MLIPPVLAPSEEPSFQQRRYGRWPCCDRAADQRDEIAPF
jgi:hypothetical protein